MGNETSKDQESKTIFYRYDLFAHHCHDKDNEYSVIFSFDLYVYTCN